MSFVAIAIGGSALIGLAANQYNKNQQDTANKRALGQSTNLLNSRKDYEIPEELKRAYNLSLNNAEGQSDIQTRLDNVANRRLGQQLSNNSRYATSGSEAQLGASGALQNYGENLDQSAVAGSQQHQQNLQNLYGVTNTIANQKQTAYGYNQQYPLEQRLAFLSAMQQNAANEGIANANANSSLIGSLGSSAANALLSRGTSGAGTNTGGSH